MRHLWKALEKAYQVVAQIANSAAKEARQVLFQPPYKFIRLDLSLENYRDLFFATEFFNDLKNSLIAAAGAIALNVVAATLAGYGLTRFEFWAKRVRAFLDDMHGVK